MRQSSKVRNFKWTNFEKTQNRPKLVKPSALSRASVGDQHSATWGLQFSKTFEIFKKLKILKKLKIVQNLSNQVH
jgi:hypothetical protein